MSWLTPLGFLGLIGLIVLIIIYIIKPNYQNKIISSTFVWKLSLKYKKNKIPISKLRNVLLFLCQILIITLAACILAQPFIDNTKPTSTEKVLIIDASASMMANVGGQSRFEKAVEEARRDADALILEEGGKVSIILANTSPAFIVQQSNSTTEVYDALNKLVDPAGKDGCTYGDANINAAIKLAEKVSTTTPNVEVVLYTDVEYINPGKVTVKPIRDISDWNAAILDVRAVSFENKYRFEIDVACYGKNADITVYCDINGVNETTDTIKLQADARCTNDTAFTVVFDPTEVEDIADLYGFNNLYVTISENDSLDIDNTFYLYGGQKLPLRIQYCSSAPNNYFDVAFKVIREKLSYRWDIDLKVLKKEETPETEGFDIYIYEHVMPSTLPTDGLVILSDPDEVPTNGGFRMGMERQFHSEQYLSGSDEELHPLLNMITPGSISVTKYTTITSYDGYTPLLFCEDNPVLLVKNDSDQKVVLMPFSLNYSNLALLLEFPLLMYNCVEYFLPSTTTDYVFDVNETISFNCRSDELEISGANVNQTFTEFPNQLQLVTPGSYTMTQTPLSNEEIIENFFVKISKLESNINRQEDDMPELYTFVELESANTDLLFYFAIALVMLLFAEWWLHTREQY